MPFKLLIVQDKPPLRHLPADAATLSGFEIVGQCVEPGEAMALFKENQPEVILFDLVLPVEDRLSQVRRMLQQAPATLVVVCSSFDSAAEVSRAFAAGVHRCLRRPYRGDELRRLFENLHAELDQTVALRA